MLKILYTACLGLSLVMSAQFALEMCLTAKNRQKIHCRLFSCLGSSKVIAFIVNRQPVYDFLLVISSNPGSILHCF